MNRSFNTGRRQLDVAHVRAIVEEGILAPSGGNMQPWRFVWYENERLSCFVDRARSSTLLDSGFRAPQLALGAAIENIVVASASHGLEAQLVEHPKANITPPLATIFFSAVAASVEAARLARFITERITNRRLGGAEVIADATSQELSRVASGASATLHLIATPSKRQEISTIIAADDRFGFSCPRLRKETFDELRWTPKVVDRTRDGIDVRTIELSSLVQIALRLCACPLLSRVLPKRQQRAHIKKLSYRMATAASAIVLLTVSTTLASTYITGGRAMQRLWLTATKLGLALQSTTVLPYLFALLDEQHTFSEIETKELQTLRSRLCTAFGDSLEQQTPVLLFRIALAPSPSVRSRRRQVDDGLFCERT